MGLQGLPVRLRVVGPAYRLKGRGRVVRVCRLREVRVVLLRRGIRVGRGGCGGIRG